MAIPDEKTMKAILDEVVKDMSHKIFEDLIKSYPPYHMNCRSESPRPSRVDMSSYDGVTIDGESRSLDIPLQLEKK